MNIFEMTADQPIEDQSWQDFREQCRRQMARPLAQRIQYGFCRMHKPVLDDAEWRVFDKDQDVSAESVAWKSGMAKTRATLPWVVIANDSSTFEGPLPVTKAEYLILLRKYGGQ